MFDKRWIFVSLNEEDLKSPIELKSFDDDYAGRVWLLMFASLQCADIVVPMICDFFATILKGDNLINIKAPITLNAVATALTFGKWTSKCIGIFLCAYLNGYYSFDNGFSESFKSTPDTL